MKQIPEGDLYGAQGHLKINRDLPSREPASLIHEQKCPDLRPDAPCSDLEDLRSPNPVPYFS